MTAESSKIEKIPLIPEECELNGISIVEAGAGTGKTYTIQKLILRVLLEKKVPLPKILVVTFTVDATGELLERLHAILQLTRDALESDLTAKGIGEDKQYDQISRILEKLRIDDPDNRKECLRLIRDALQDYDQAAVMTIHGFCQRMLMDNALQSLLRYGAEIRPDYSNVEQKIAMDFCRKVLYSPNAPESCFDLDPATLLNYMKSALSNTSNGTEIRFAEFEEIDERTRKESIRQIKTPASWDPLRKITNDSLIVAGKDFLREHLAASFSVLADQIAAAIDREVKTGKDKTAYLLSMAQKLSRDAFSVYLKERANEALSTDADFVPFFEMTDNILKLIRQEENVIGKEFLDFYQKEMEKYKAKEGFLTFDDLISRMAKMVESPNGQSLCENIRRTFSYVFVDEFQDTDPEQYCIFSRLFGEGTNRGFFMIGDPKQAIYSFRGGDVYAYLSAVRNAPEHRHFYTLARNYRSGQKYIDELNEFYTKQNDPFNNPEICFSEIIWGKTVKDNLLHGTVPEEKPLQFQKLTKKEDVIQWTVEKVQELLFSGNYFIGEENGGKKNPVSAKDIAILFPTKRFGGELEKALNAKDINTVWLSESNIFQLPEALVVWRFLEMLYDGVRSRDMVSVLSDGLFMFTAKEIQKVLQPDSETGILVQQYFLDLRKIWENKGIHAMFRELLDVPNAKGRPWLKQVRDVGEDGIGDRFQDNATLAVHIFQSDPTDGPYILGHIRQLVDKLHNAARKRQLTPGGLLVYLRGMINQENYQEDNGLAQNVQRNTDSSAVRLITLHKSKGLEFPIVLLPEVPTHKNKHAVNRLYHGPDGKRIVDMTGWLSNGSLTDNPAPEEEFLEERLRLLYVGLTRAKYACFVPYSLGPTHGYKKVISKISPVLDSFSAKKFDQSYAPASAPQEVVAANRKFDGSFVFDWQAGSFSSFNKGFHLDPAAADVDPGTLQTDVSGGDDEDEKEDVEPADGKTGAENGKKEEKDPASLPKDEEQKAIFSFAGGEEAGTIWHEIFELMEFHPEGLSGETDFSPDADMMLLEKLPRKSLYSAIRRRKDEDEETPKLDKAFARMLKGILCNPLTGKTETLFLKDIPPQQCARELRFLYVLKSSVSLKKVKECLEKYGIPTGDWANSAETERTDWALTGSLDLLCRSQSGKYYVIDWKTNRRNGKLTDFSPAGVEQEVIAKMYSLQYLIYTVALWHFIHERLGIELTRENYDRYFGGVFYLFVRGIAAPLPEMTAEQKDICCKRGIFYKLPPYELLEEFKGLLDIRPQTNGAERN